MKTTISIYVIISLFLMSCAESSNKQNDISTKGEVLLRAFGIEKQELNTTLQKASFGLSLIKECQKFTEGYTLNIKSKNPGSDRYFILYYLPDMKIGSGAWATSHFNPSLSVNIQGISDRDQAKMTCNPLPKGVLVGKWFDNRPYVENTMIIYKKDGFIS